MGDALFGVVGLCRAAATLKRRLEAIGSPVLPSSSHIVLLHVGDATLCREVSRRLLDKFLMYATPINYPTVRCGAARRGAVRLRFTPGPFHTDAIMERLVEALGVMLRGRREGGSEE